MFQETVDNEKEHTEIFFKYLEGGMAKIIASYLSRKIGETKEKLERRILFPTSAEVTSKEDPKEVSKTFQGLDDVERYHGRLYRKLLTNVKLRKVFKSDSVTKWKCRNNGFVIEGKEAPEKYPVCNHTKSNFELSCENYRLLSKQEVKEFD